MPQPRRRIFFVTRDFQPQAPVDAHGLAELVARECPGAHDHGDAAAGSVWVLGQVNTPFAIEHDVDTGIALVAEDATTPAARGMPRDAVDAAPVEFAAPAPAQAQVDEIGIFDKLSAIVRVETRSAGRYPSGSGFRPRTQDYKSMTDNDAMKSAKPFLILQLRPEDDTSLSEYEAILKHGGLDAADTRRVRIEVNGIPEVSLDDYAAIIVGGSPFDISTPAEKKSANQKRIEADFRRLFDAVVAADFPFLGACSGCGLLGSYLSTPISRRYAEPVGGTRVRLTDAGSRDPLLEGFPPEIGVLCGHKEACDRLPDGATLLLTNDDCPVQMFRVGQNVYATQFHPEGDAEGFTVRIHAYKHHGYFPPETADDLIVAISREDTPWSREILRRFVERYAA